MYFSIDVTTILSGAITRHVRNLLMLCEMRRHDTILPVPYAIYRHDAISRRGRIYAAS